MKCLSKFFFLIFAVPCFISSEVIADKGSPTENQAKEEKEYAILSAEIANATFGLMPSEHKKLKGLKNQNLRDHMTDLGLVFTMLGRLQQQKLLFRMMLKDFVKIERQLEKAEKSPVMPEESWSAKAATKWLASPTF